MTNNANANNIELVVQHLKMIAHGWGERKDEALSKEECEVLLNFIEETEKLKAIEDEEW